MIAATDVGKNPENIDHLFVSNQSLNSKKLFEVTLEDYYDFIIVDEFHHAAAPSYQKLLSYYKSKILLGLIATPERNDEKEIFSLNKYIIYINDIIGLGFCVSIEHAVFMAKRFNELNIQSIALTSKSSIDERNKAKESLVNGSIKFIFVVDLCNEGVDIPEVNTILFLSPTESLTVVLQQLGRGLRLSEGKE